VTRKTPYLALIFSMAAAAAAAEPATPEGARHVLDGYVATLGPEIADKGIVTVDPQGESYKVTWHISRALDLAGAPASAVQIGDFAYEITPGAGGAWRMTADAFPSITFDTPTDKGRVSGKIDLTGMNIDTSYDPAQPSPFVSRSVFGDIVADLRILEEGKVVPIRIKESDVKLDMKQTTTDVGANLALHETLGAFAERISVPIETQPNAKIDVTFKLGAGSVDATIDQLRTREALAAWRFILAHKDQPGDETTGNALKAILAPGLPGWEKIEVVTTLSDLAFDLSLGEAHMKGFRETLDLPGFTEVATGGFGLKIDELDMRAPFLPEGFEQLLPLSLDFDFAVKLKGLDQIAKIALADPEFTLDKDVSPEAQAKIDDIFKSSEPTFTLAPGYLRSPLIDLAFEGEVKVSPDDSLEGRIVLSADTLDKVIAFVKPFAVFSPDLEKAMLGVAAVKGMAKTGPDGRLVWDIEMSGPPARVTVNGVAVPIDQ
jgi:hypothetical protein